MTPDELRVLRAFAHDHAGRDARAEFIVSSIFKLIYVAAGFGMAWWFYTTQVKPLYPLYHQISVAISAFTQ
jgi:hypothetical protein